MLRKNTTVNMSKIEYEEALVSACAQLDDLMMLRIRGKPVETKSRYFSSKLVAPQKKQRAAGPGNKTSARTQPAPSLSGAAAIQSDSWSGSGWCEEAASYTAAKKATPKLDVEAYKKKGSFLCKPTFSNVLAPDLARKYCGKFLCFGKYCDPKHNCTKVHIPFFKFGREEKETQYEHVLENLDNLAINKNDAPRNIPEKYAHLVKAPGQGAN